jgi:catechol 2,3-dioxygenase-like lactoylglutathione lyase family enzyme
MIGNGGAQMESQKLYRGRLLDHLQLVVRDLSVSKRFYEAIFASLDIPLGGSANDYFWADELFISTQESRASQGQLTGRAHLAFQASSRAAVENFHRAGLEAGGVNNGDPGERPYHPGYYAAFLLDPDGNNIEAVFHGPAKRSTPAIEIAF